MCRQTDRPTVTFCLTIFLLGCFFVACSDDESASPTTPDPPDPPDQGESITITGLILEDDLGTLATDSGDGVSGEIPLLVGESAAVRIRIVTDEGTPDPIDADSTLIVTVLVDHPDLLSATMDTTSEPTSLQLLGLEVATASVGVVISDPDSVLYASGRIPVSIENPATDVFRFVLRTDTGEHFWSDGPLFLDLGATVGPVRLEFLGYGAEPVPPRLLGRQARVELIESQPGVLEVSQNPTTPLEFGLHALEEGETRLDVRLLRGDEVVYESDRLEIGVVDRTGEGWGGFEEGNAPNGPVWDLVEFEGKLVAGGEFSSVGAMRTNGVALWNGAFWHEMGDGPGPVRWLLCDERKLVASTVAGGFYEWTGADWILVRDGSPGQRGVLRRGEVVVASDLPTWEPPEGPYTCSTGGLLTLHEDTLYMTVDCQNHYPMPTAFASLEVLAADQWTNVFTVHEVPQGLSSVSIDYLGSHSGTLLSQWSNVGTGGSIFAVERVSGTDYSRVTTGIRLEGFTILDDTLYLASRTHLWVHNDIGDRSLGVVDNTGPQFPWIHDVEDFQGSVFICGKFDRVETVESRNIAFWRPE